MKKHVLLAARILTIFTVAFSLTTCGDFLKPGLGDEVDLEDPDVTIDSHRDGQYLSGQVTFEGTFADDIAGDSIRISTNGGSNFSSATRVDKKNGAWSHDVDTTQLADGEYEVRVRVTDTADKTTDAKILVYFDNTAPAMLVRTPQGLSLTTFNQTISVSGDAYDPFGVTTVELELYETDGSGNVIQQLALRRDQAGLDAVASGDPLYDTADGTSSWTYPFDTSLYTGAVQDYRINVRATDRAGNSRETVFHVDTLSQELGTIPTVNDLYEAQASSSDIDGVPLTDLTGASLDLTVDQEQDLPQFEFSIPSPSDPGLGADPRATGAVTDDDGVVTSSIEILIDADPATAADTDWVQVTSTSGSGGRVSWEHDLTGLSQGSHTMAVRAEDINGVVAVSPDPADLVPGNGVLDFAIDAGPPILSIAAPTAGTYHNTDIALSGTVGDGTGIAAVEVSSDDGATWTDASFSLASGETNIWDWSFAYTEPTSGTPPPDGTITFRVRATDMAAKTDTESVQVTLDLSNPVLEFLAPEDNAEVNGSLLFQGATEDRSRIAELAFFDVPYASIDGSTVPLATLTDSTNEFDPDSGGNDSSYYRWYKNVDTTAYQTTGNPAVNETFTIRATDAAGNVGYAEVPVTIDQETDIPVFTIDSGSLVDGEYVYSTSTSLVGTVEDDDSIDPTTAEYSLVPQGDADSWQALLPGTTDPVVSKRWSIPLPAAGGPYTLKLRVDDVNASPTSGSLEITDLILDAGPPAVTENQSGAVDATPIYRNTDVLLGGTATDGLGVASVVVERENPDSSTTTLLTDTNDDGVWAITMPAAAGDGSYVITITAEDTATQTSSITRNIVIDTTNPSAEITSINPVIDTNTVNGVVTVRASVADELALASTEWAILPDGQAPVDADYTVVDGTQISPEFEIDTTTTAGNVTVNGTGVYDRTLADEAISVLWLRATDRAGNTFSLSQPLSVSQASDAPVIEFTTLDDTVSTAAESYRNLIESNGLIRFNVTDDDRVDSSSIEISIGDNTSYQTINYNGGSTPSDARSVTTSHDLYNPTVLAEGTTSFYLQVSDEATAKTLPVTQTEVGPIYLMIDRNFPTLTETALGGDVFRSALFEISGNVSDTNALSSVTMTESKDGAVATTVLDQTLSGTSAAWSVTDMPGSGSVVDGEYLYTITVTDASDKVTELTRTVTIDTTTPAAPVVSSPVADDWLNSTSFNFEGTADDGTGSGIAAVYFVETARGAGAPAKPADPAIGGDGWSAATVASGGAWTASVNIAAAGEREFHAYAVDEAGNDGSITTHNFGLDQASPSVTVTGGTASTQYENGDFTIDGSFTDASGLSALTVETSTDNVTFTAADPASASFTYDAATGSGTWNWDRVIGGQTDGTYYYRFSFTDEAGNSTQVTKVVNLDTSAPTITFTSTDPSIDFDGATQTATGNGLMALSGDVDEDQGTGNLQTLQYSIDSGAWSDLPLNGSFSISGIDTTGIPTTGTMTVDVEAIDRNGNSTVEQFTLNVDQSSDLPQITVSSPANNATISTPDFTVSGNITDDDGVTGDPGTIEYRYSADGGATWDPWVNVTDITGTAASRGFSFNVATNSDGAKGIQIRATDETGTVSDPADLTVTLDTAEPELTGLAPADGSSFNANFDVSGTINDDGTYELTYRVERDGSQTESGTILPAGSSGSQAFSQTIDTSFGSGSYEVFLTATDESNNSRERSINVAVDTAAPSITFSSPTGGSTQNNSIQITGSSSDGDSGVSSVEFFVVDTGGTEHTLADAFTGTDPTVTGTTDWTISAFDTRDTGLVSLAEDLTGGVYEVTLRAAVTDTAGNTWDTGQDGSDLVFRIDQMSDAPVVTFDELSTSSTVTITTRTIRGTVTDDDGVSAIAVDTWNVGNSTETPDTSETVTLTSGSYGDQNVAWRVDLTDIGNGLRGIRVRAIDTVDNNGQDYTATDYSRVDTGRVDFRLDTENPDIAFSTPSANITWSSNDTFEVTGTSGDETGITALAYKIDDNDFTSGTTTITPPLDTWSFTIAQGDIGDGGHTIYVQATDSVGNTSVASRNVSVDKTGPTIDVTSPANGSDVYGPLTIGGTAADNAGGAGVASISVGLGKQIDPGDLAGSTWTAVAGTTSWSFEFANVNDYANTTYSYNTGDTDRDDIEDAGETWTDLWEFTFYVRAIDQAGDTGGGNVSYLTSYTLTIDPKRDRPEVDVLSPDDGATVGGFLRVFGSSFDGQFIEKVQIAIDANNNGDYSDDIWNEGTLDETDTDGVNWYLADGTTSWNVSLNENSEFDPTGGDTTNTISFKVRAWDYKTTPGDGIPGGAVERTVTFNKSFPRFDNMSLTSGETVGGIVTLTGIVRDETDIDRIIFSNEGPLLDNTVIFDNPGNLTVGTTTQVVATKANPYGGSDVTVSLIGPELANGDPNPDYDPAYTSYLINVPIDTEATGLYPNGAGSMSVKVTAEDVTSPSPYTNQNLISFSVDNVDPSELSYTGDTEIIGTAAELQGTVRDTGTVAGIESVVVYMTNAAGDIVRLNGGTGSIAASNETQVLDPDDFTYADYRIVIDNSLEDGNDGGAAGDGDGFDEFLTLSAGTYNWSGLFDSSLVNDGAVTVNYVATDYAGNSTAGSTAAFVANNKPEIDSIVLGTDIDGNGTVDVDEYTSPLTGGYGATGYTARNNRLYFDITASSGNGTLRYSVWYDADTDGVFDAGEEQNGTLTNNTLVIDTSGFADSAVNGASFEITVYDSTTSDDNDPTNELSDTVTVGLTIDNVDETPPSIAVAPFGRTYTESSDDAAKVLQDVASYEENVAVDGSGNRLGHLEYAADSLYDNGATSGDGTDDDADVSGTVVFKGKAEDNQNISRITAQIPGYNGSAAFDIYNASLGGAQSGTDWAFSIDGAEYLTDENGNVFNWNFEWDTAAIASVVANNVPVTFTVYDANATPNTAGSALTVDVVPYVSGIENTSNLYGLSNDVLRSATGVYAIDQSAVAANTFRIDGFNFDDATLDVRLSAAPISVDTNGTSIIGQKNGTATATAVEMNKDFAVSGYLTVFVNSIPALNNINDNTLSQASEYDPIRPRSRQWTDDRYLRVWSVTQMLPGATNSTFYYPDMMMDGNQPVFSYTNDNEGSTRRTTSDTTSRQLGALWYERQTSIARDSSGNYYVASVQDAFSGTDIGYLYLNRDRNATPAYGPDNLGNFVELVGEEYVNTQLNRFRYPQLIVEGPQNAARTYLSVYDAHPDEKDIKFFAFEMRGVTNTNLNEPGNDDEIAGNGWVSIPGTQNGASSQYFDMVKIGAATDAGHKIVVPYYDETEASLKVKYAVDPVDANGLYDPATTWYELSIEPANSYAGTHVSATTDGTDVYLAYHDSANADLKVAKVPGSLLVASGGTGTVETYTVDSYLSTGTWTNITMIDGVPHVSYFSGSYNGTRSPIRMAYPLTSTTALNDGVIGGGTSDEYSGDWEVTAVPATSVPKGGMAQFNRTQIAQYADGSNLPVLGWLADRLEYARMRPEAP